MLSDRGQGRRLTAAVIGAVATCAVAAGGCGTAASSASGDPRGHHDPKLVVARDAANGTTVSLGVGDSLRLILSSSYWKVSGSSAPRVLRQDGTAVLPARPSSCPDIAGLGCTPVRIAFAALTRGTAVIKASRTTCGEALRCAGKRATQFTLTVVVR